MSSSTGKPRPLFVCFTLAVLALAVSGSAQDGVSTAGAARAKYLGNRGLIPTPREIVVEDFINYHRHEIGRPRAGEAVGLDVRWSSDAVSGGGDVVLQVGLATALANDRQQLRPVNLSLVIDKSGSMAEADKLSRVKTALLTLVSQLRETDTLSIVVFDAEAQVLLPSQLVADRNRIKDLIRGLAPGSTTNLNAGLMLGYQEALKGYKKGSTNRVVILTDGIANRGVTDQKQIADASLGYNDRGIDLSTIGVGQDLNTDLLSSLAKSGRGLYHFVADPQDIEKVFVKELQSLISPVATEPQLKIEYGSGLELVKVYGYSPELGEGSVKLKLDNLNSGATQVVLLRFKSRAKTLDRSSLPVKVRLSYYDLESSKTVETAQSSTIKLSESAQKDSSVTKNFSIALLAQAIHDMALACESERFREAEHVLNTAIEETSRRYPNLEDEDIKRTLLIAKKYQGIIQKENAVHETDRPDQGFERSNLITNGDFSLGNSGFVSDLEYIKPSPNCLWGLYYTVVSAFNSPVQLHTNIPTQSFPAPGGGQVMFMNSGTTDQFTVWTSSVRCNPGTKYRVSFKEIGLSGGREWINTYEIRINGVRSEPQLGGDGKYVEVAFDWDSGPATTATVSIVRLPNAHRGGIIGIANIKMVAAR